MSLFESNFSSHFLLLLTAACQSAVMDYSLDRPEYMLMPITDMMTRDSVVLHVRSCKSVEISLQNLPGPDYGWRRVCRLVQNHPVCLSTRLSVCAPVFLSLPSCLSISASPPPLSGLNTVACTFHTHHRFGAEESFYSH